MNSHFHFLIIVEMVDAPVMLHRSKRTRTTWGTVRTLGRTVLYSHVPDGLVPPIATVNVKSTAPEFSAPFSQMLHLSYVIKIHLYQLVVNVDWRKIHFIHFTYSYKLGNLTYWTFPINQFSGWIHSIHTCKLSQGNSMRFLTITTRNCQTSKNITDTSWQQTQCPFWSP